MEDAESLGKTKKAIEQIRQRQETSEQLCRQTQETIKQFQYQLESESGQQNVQQLRLQQEDERKRKSVQRLGFTPNDGVQDLSGYDPFKEDLRDVAFNTGWKYHTKYDNFDRIHSVNDLLGINPIRMDEYKRDVERFGVYCLLYFPLGVLAIRWLSLIIKALVKFVVEND